MSYEGNATRATALIKRKGKAITIVRAADTYAPITGDFTGTPVNITGFGVFMPFEDSALIDGIERGDVQLITNQLSATPEAGDTVEGFKIISVITTAPDNDTVVIYELQLRR